MKNQYINEFGNKIIFMNEEKSNEKNIQKKKWNHILYEHGDLPKIGLFFKELFSGMGDYGNMGFFN